MIRFCLDLSLSSSFTFYLSISIIPLSIHSLSTPLQLHLSSRPRGSPSLYSPVIPSVHSTLPGGVGGRPPVLAALHLTFSPLPPSNRRPSHANSYGLTSPLARWRQRLTLPSNFRPRWTDDPTGKQKPTNLTSLHKML